MHAVVGADGERPHHRSEPAAKMELRRLQHRAGSRRGQRSHPLVRSSSPFFYLVHCCLPGRSFCFFFNLNWSPQAIFKDPFRKGNNILVSLCVPSCFTLISLRSHKKTASFFNIQKKFSLNHVSKSFFFKKNLASKLKLVGLLCFLFKLLYLLYRWCVTATRHKASQSPVTRGTKLPRFSATPMLQLRCHGMNVDPVSDSVSFFFSAYKKSAFQFAVVASHDRRWYSSDQNRQKILL